MPSQRLNEDPHLPWFAINLRATSVETAHCICMASLEASCSHIGALLFKSETAVRAGFTKKTGFPLVGENWGDPLHYPKNWLVPPISPHCFDPKCRFCHFHAVFGHFAQIALLTSRPHLGDPGKPVLMLLAHGIKTL